MPDIIIQNHGGLLYEHMPYQAAKPYGKFSMFGTNTKNQKPQFNTWPCKVCGELLNDISFKGGRKKELCNECFKMLRKESDNLVSKARYYFKTWPKIIENNLEWIL